jgi:hypothetical protein
MKRMKHQPLILCAALIKTIITVLTLTAGNQYALPQGPGAYLLKGADLALTPAATRAIDQGASLPEVTDDICRRPRLGRPNRFCGE